MAAEVNMAIGELIHFAADCHIYEDQMDAVTQQMEQYREMVEEETETEIPPQYPVVRIKNKKPLGEYLWDDFEVMEYHPKAFIPTPVTE